MAAATINCRRRSDCSPGLMHHNRDADDARFPLPCGARNRTHLEISPASTARPCTASVAVNLGQANCLMTSRTRAS